MKKQQAKIRGIIHSSIKLLVKLNLYLCLKGFSTNKYVNVARAKQAVKIMLQIVAVLLILK
ncbi:hypothetical protein [Francisella orientalis]|uniref:hypothetical protein n=1 Tax=Francisella orientalis TaxID=299583 RepID=UPI00214C13A9|nr:hypothetical protein [Francisella orientalis]